MDVGMWMPLSLPIPPVDDKIKPGDRVEEENRELRKIYCRTEKTAT